MKKPLIILVVILTIGAVFYFIDKPGGLIDKDIKDVKTDKPIVIDPSKLGSEPLSPEEQKGLPNGISTTTTTTTVNTKSSVATDGPKPLSPTEQKQVVESSPAPTKTNTAGSPKTLSQEEQRKLMESNASNPPPPFPEN
jgi:hypothetical protein